MMLRWPWMILLSLCLWDCAPDSGAPVPRRRAYPRVETPDTAFTTLTGLPVSMSVNGSQPTETVTKADGSVWLTVRYPAYGASVLCTFTPVDETSISRVLDNRYERMSLNAGGGELALEEFDGADSYHSAILLSHASSATPVQFITAPTVNPRWVVSGSVYFENTSSSVSTDSVRPIIDIMHGEVTRMLKSIKTRHT
ncbi:MAG: hypothetical protein K2K05_01065 [Muribaculaceae bacterium]|nr:hypothetical protein [Muribaculaceae bacterium]